MTGKRGRPRKYPEITKEKLNEVTEIWDGKDAFTFARKLEEEAKKRNPDREPATKGYVKCLIRNTREHTHRYNDYPLLSSLGLGIGWMVAIIILVAQSRSGLNSLGAVIAFALACTITFLDGIYKNDSTEGVRESTNPKIIQKYNPPPCKQSDDCSEDQP